LDGTVDSDGFIPFNFVFDSGMNGYGYMQVLVHVEPYTGAQDSPYTTGVTIAVGTADNTSGVWQTGMNPAVTVYITQSSLPEGVIEYSGSLTANDLQWQGAGSQEMLTIQFTSYCVTVIMSEKDGQRLV
jgi:hypothetical protein